MSIHYPDGGVGIKLKKSIISQDDLEHLKQNLPDNVILRVFGFAGTGKGTLSSSLSQILNIPNVESSLVWRAITVAYEDMGLVLNEENSDIVINKLEVLPSDNNLLTVKYKGEIIDRSVLKSPKVDAKVAYYSADGYLRERFYDIIIAFLQNINRSCVLDGRGAYPRYILEAEKSGFKIVRLLLDASQEEMASRYYTAYTQKIQRDNPNYVESEEQKQLIIQDFKQGITLRNRKDLETWNHLNLGIITPDTGILDTTGMTVDEVTLTMLSFIKKELKI